MSESTDKVIEYAPRQKVHLSRRAKHVTLIVVALVISAILAPRVYQLLHRKWLAHRMAAFAFPTGSAVIDESYSIPGGVLSRSTSSVPPEFGDLLPAAGRTVFIGQLVDPSNCAWLVRINYINIAFRGGNLGGRILFTWSAIPRTNLSNAPVTGTSAMLIELDQLSPITSMRLLSPQRNQSNASHVTLLMTINDARRIIDGYLNDDGTMTLELRDSPTTSTG